MDDLTRIKGIGPATAKKLAAAGIATVAALAAAIPDALTEFTRSTAEAEAWIAEAIEVARGEKDGGSGPAKDASTVPLDLDELLTESGCETAQELIDMAKVGRKLMDAIAVHHGQEGPLKDWTPAGDPAEVVGDLVEMVNEARAAAAETGSGMETTDTGWAARAPASFETEFPLTTALMAAWPGDNAPMLRIAAKPKSGFRRAGMAHPHEAVDHRLDAFTPGQIEQLLGESNLTVELVAARG